MGHSRQILVSLVIGLCLFGALHGQRSPQAARPQADLRVDINHASLDELMKVPGMTRVWAARIVRFRPYRAKNELLDRGIVSNEVYARIKESIIAHRDKQ